MKKQTEPLPCQRHLFSLPEGAHYLNCAMLSPLLKSVEAAGIEGVKRKSVPMRLTPQDWFTEPEALRGLIGRLVNCRAEQVALIPSASYGVALATHNVALRRGQNVVLPGEEFPSDVYGWRERCRQDGAALQLVERPAGAARPAQEWTARLLEAITPGTAVVHLTAVHWTDGTRFDLDAIAARTRQVGALLIVDGTQSVGALPFDFSAIRPDLLVVAGYKWLLGPYQYGFAALGERLLADPPQGWRPLEENWLNRQGSEDFSRLTEYRDAMQPGARRFDAGEHSNFILVPMLLAALRQILDWRVERISAYCEALRLHLEQRLRGSRYLMAPPGEHCPHLFGIQVPPGADVRSLVEQLKRRDVHVSVRGSSVRVSPHVYNSPADLDALAEALLAQG